jgi:hypothetical protein
MVGQSMGVDPKKGNEVLGCIQQMIQLPSWSLLDTETSNIRMFSMKAWLVIQPW